MSQPLTLRYRSVMAEVVGPDHGLAEAELDALSPQVARMVAGIEAERPRGKRRYRDLPRDAAMLTHVRAMADKFRPRCDNLVVLGIGGSALGNIALQTALNPGIYNLLSPERRSGPRLFVVDNVDPMQFGDVLDLLEPELARTCFNVISKSGETAETAAQYLAVCGLLERKLGAAAARQQIVATTDPRVGTLRDIANVAGYDTLDVPDGVGGRFSVLSAVGLFSAAMCGIDIASVLAGAADMSDRVAEPALRRNPAALIAAIHHLFMQRGKPIHVMMPYSARLKDLADWYRQLWAESLGKRRDLQGRDVFVGPTPVKALGATDQHSQVQLYREGPHDKVFTFLTVREFARDVPIPSAADTPEPMGYLSGATFAQLLNSEQAATEYALVQAGRPCLTIEFNSISPESIGAFFMLYEAATSIMGLLLGIDAYDQPAVQLGKEGTFALMGRRGFEKLAAEIRKTVGAADGHSS